MRRLVAVSLPLVLQVGALCAPLVHAHLGDHHDGHHEAPTVHAHLGGHGHGPAEAGRHVHAASGFSRTAIAAHDDAEDATRLQIFVAVAAVPFVAPALPPARFVLAPPPASVMRRGPEEVRSHGPPDARTASPRAPPALPV